MDYRQFNEFWDSIGDFIGSYGPTICVIVGGIGLATLPTLPYGINWYDKIVYLKLSMVISVIFLYIVGAVISNSRNKDFWRIQNRIEQLEEIIKSFGENIFKIWELRLSVIANDLELGHSERVSIYNFENDKFVMLGRYSMNPTFNTSGRGVYPANQGCIQKAWCEGFAEVQDLPDPDNNYQDYKDCLKNDWSINNSVVDKLSMKSRSFVGIAIDDVKGINKAAVIIFESIKSNGLNTDKIKSSFDKSIGNEIKLLIDILKPLEPSPDIAKKGGF